MTNKSELSLNITISWEFTRPFCCIASKSVKKKMKRASFIMFSQSGWVMASVLQRPSSIAATDQRRDGNSAILRESARTEEMSLF